MEKNILCKNEIATNCHLLFKCDKIAPLWKMIYNFIHSICHLDIFCNEDEILFGVAMEENKPVEIIVNFILLETGKWNVWNNRNNVRYGDSLCLACDILLDNITKSCRDKAVLIIRTLVKNKQKIL